MDGAMKFPPVETVTVSYQCLPRLIALNWTAMITLIWPTTFLAPVIAIDVKLHTKPTPLPEDTQTTQKKRQAEKQFNQKLLLEMQYEVVKMQKGIILLKIAKLKLQIAQLKEQGNGGTLMSSVQSL